MDLAEIDHIYPYEGGGVNSVHNAQVLSSDENNAKGATYPWAPQSGRSRKYEARCAGALSTVLPGATCTVVR